MLLTLKFFEKKPDSEIELRDDVTHCSAGGGFLYTADASGKISQIDHNGNVISTESNLEHISYLHAGQATQDILVAMITGNTLQIVSLNSSNFIEDMVTPGSPFMLQVKSKATDITLVTTSANLTYLVFVNNLNELMIYKAPYSTRSKPIILYNLPETPTNLNVTESGLIFITSKQSVNTFNIVSKQYGPLEDRGVDSGFTALTNNDTFYAFRNKNVTLFKGASLQRSTHELDSVPRQVGTAGQYVYTATNTQMSSSFQVMDLEYGLLVNSQNLGSTVRFVSYQWGAMIIINNARSVRMYHEMKAQRKIDILCKNLRFELALRMAEQLSLGAAITANIHQLYGDHLFNQHQFSAAIDHYILTIGYTEPSHVIAKFVEPHHAENLANYLVKLPKALATKQHTTLLFNCYTKVRATGKLDAIVSEFVAAAERNEEPAFDVETAVDVLKRNGYQKHAEDLARAFHQHGLFLELLHEDGPNYAKMAAYLEEVPGELIVEKLTQYGSELMTNFPECKSRLIDFAVKCCTEGVANGYKQGTTTVNPETLTTLFLNNDREHFDFLYKIFQSGYKMPPATWNVLLEMSLRAAPEHVTELLTAEGAEYSPEQVLIYMNAFGKNEGREIIYEQLHLYHLILQDAEPERCLEICRRFGDERPSLWGDGLVKLAASECPEDVLIAFVDAVHQINALPYLEILDILMKGGKHRLKTVLALSQSVFAKEQELLRAADKSKRENEEKAKACQDQVAALTKGNFQIKRNRCEHCGLDIEGESIHFFCGHAFHRNCLGDSTEFCPLCRIEIEQVVNAKLARLERAADNDGVEKAVEEAGDGFSFLLGEISASLFASGTDLEAPAGSVDVAAGPRELLKRLQSS